MPSVRIRENEYFDDMDGQGYNIHVYHPDYIDFCAGFEAQIVSCQTFPSTGIRPLATLRLSPLVKAELVLKTFARLSVTEQALAQYYTVLEREAPGNVIYTGFLGVLAAQRGDRTAAQHIVARLEAMKRDAVRRDMQTSYWQAKIAALLGDRAGAVGHIIDVVGEQGRFIHPDTDLDSLRSYARFQELIRPKG